MELLSRQYSQTISKQYFKEMSQKYFNMYIFRCLVTKIDGILFCQILVDFVAMATL